MKQIFLLSEQCASHGVLAYRQAIVDYYYKSLITGYRIIIIYFFLSCGWNVIKWFFEEGYGIQNFTDEERSATADLSGLIQFDIRGPSKTCLIWEADFSYNQPEANLTVVWLKRFSENIVERLTTKKI